MRQAFSQAFRSVCQIGLIAGSMILTGCGATLTQVKTPIPVVCQEAAPDRPAMDTETLDPAAPVDVQSRAMRAEIDTREAYELKLRAGLVNCTRPLAPP